MKALSRQPAVLASWRIRPAVTDDDANKLLALETATSLGGIHASYKLRFFFGRAQLYEVTRTLIAAQEDRVIGTASGAVKRIHLGGQEQLVGHIFNVRVAPLSRRIGVARSLVGALEAWFTSEGAAAAYCLVGEQNEASRHLFSARGYRDISRAAYLVDRRPRILLPQTGALIDLAANQAWSNRIVKPSTDYDFCPVDMLNTLYKRRVLGGYLGTFIANVHGDASWLSVWDKDAAIGREPIKPSLRTLFLYDLHLTSADAWQILVAAVYNRWRFARRAVLFMDINDITCFDRRQMPSIDRIEVVMAKLPASLALSDRIYLDIRD